MAEVLQFGPATIPWCGDDGGPQMRKTDRANVPVATSGTVREINRRTALDIIRRNPPMSRADLARRSGMQRSTVSAIVGQLIDEGWLTEGAGGAKTRGPRPRFLHLNVERAAVVAVDVQCDTTRVGLAGIDARFLMQTTWPTPQTPSAFAEALARTVESFRRAHGELACAGIGVGVAGRVDADGRLIFAPNLGWGAVNLRELLEGLDLPVVVENAANACALAEQWFGRHVDDVRDLVAVTVSAGIGVGLLMNGQLVRGACNAMAGEFGHVTLDRNGPSCGCGKCGCWEQYASNAAAERYYQGRSAKRPTRQRRPPGSLSAVGYAEIMSLADAGDAVAIETLERQARYLGIGMAGLVTGLAPQVLVVVGEVTGAWSVAGPIIADVVSRYSLHPVATAIVASDSATQPRLRGAVTLVVQRLFGAPQGA
jgi:predicted NBD/HSP70 family sugar kinase